MKTISAATALLLLATTTAPLLAADSMPTNAGDALAQQGPDLWRGSKLVGVAIYGPGDKKVGDINDVLMNHDGKATYVVIGVGGFLGIGEKNVAVPFDQVKFTDQPMAQPLPTAPGPAGVPGALGPNGAAGTAPGTAAGTMPGAAPGAAGSVGTGVGLGMPAAPGTSTDVGMSAAPRSTSYPDHGNVTLTADQLKAAPTFQYAR